MTSCGGSPTQQHSPTSSNGSAWSGGGSPGLRPATHERTQPLQQLLPADSPPPLKDYLMLSPPHATNAVAAAAAAFSTGTGTGTGADGAPCTSCGGARWGPIGGEMRGRHDSGVCVRHSPTELVGGEQQLPEEQQQFDSLIIGAISPNALLRPTFGAQPQPACWSAQ